MTTLLNVDGITKRYRGFTLENVNFSVPAGYIMGLIGPNGAGKTTIIKLIMNLIRRDSGSIEIFGKEMRQHEAEVKARVGYVSDVPHFFDDSRMSDHVKAFSKFYPRWDEEEFERLAEEYALPLEKKAKALSQGMRIQFALALAFAHSPDLLVMDEPPTSPRTARALHRKRKSIGTVFHAHHLRSRLVRGFYHLRSARQNSFQRIDRSRKGAIRDYKRRRRGGGNT